MKYTSPFVQRYTSSGMLEIFSRERRARLWRDLWISLAKAQKKLGVPIRASQIRDMERARDRIDFRRVAHWERRTRHEVMAHIRHFGEVAPKAAPVLHLGATSAFVMDNADLIQMRDGLRLVRRWLLNVVDVLRRRVIETCSVPQLAYTHFQPAQLTTVGKRLCLWLQDLLIDLREIDQVLGEIRFLGSKGAVGTQASFLDLFRGDHEKVRRLDEMVAKDFGFKSVFPVTGQTYPRKIDARVLGALASIAQSAHKAGTDLRLLQHLGEILEPCDPEQVGSSAMPYKRNPMRAERMCSLARLVMSLHSVAVSTAATQWLERSLDDSAAKRVSVPEAFFATDAVLSVYLDIVKGLEVQEEVIRRNVERHFPFLATERILVEAVRMGGNRQALHERIRRTAVGVHRAVQEGRDNDLLERLKNEGVLGKALRQRPDLLEPGGYTGRAAEQVREFVRAEVEPLLKREKKWLGMRVDLRV